jgi:putative FmdB family regulatory protein
MPTYEYRCDACGHAFEQFQSITADPIRKCPRCAKRKVKRLIGTGAGLLFKGSGFYITDYRDQGYKDKAKAESGAPADGAAKTETAATASSNGEAAKTDKPAAADAKPATPAKSDAKPKKKHK